MSVVRYARVYVVQLLYIGKHQFFLFFLFLKQLNSYNISEGLTGVLGNKGTLAKYRREQGNISQCLGTGNKISKNYNTKTF